MAEARWPQFPRVGSLEIEQDLTLEQREWNIQRASWVLIALLLLGGLLGLLGSSGPLNRLTSRTDDQALELTGARFLRHSARTMLSFQVESGAVRDGEVRLWLSSSYLEKFELESVMPEPDIVLADGERLIFVFRATDETPAEISLSLMPEGFGGVAGRAGLDSGDALSFSQFIYP